MPGAEASVIKDSVVAPQMDRSLAASANAPLAPDFRSDPLLDHHVKYFVRVFNISRMGFSVDHPFFRAWRNGNNIPACPPDKPYVEVARFPDIVIEKFVQSESGEVRSRGERGERIAMDIINPANLGIDQEQVLSPEAELFSGAGTCDLSKRGVFFISGHDTPTPEEIAKAKARMEKFYRVLITQARELNRSGHATSIGVEMHVAADYFKIHESWHTVAELAETCPNCGQDAPKDVPFHVIAGGLICVRDWQKAVAAGVKTKADVPEDRRWWSEKPKEK